MQNDQENVRLLGLVFASAERVGAWQARPERARAWAGLGIKLKGVGSSEERACKAGSSVP